MSKYVLVSQGIAIFDTKDFDEAFEYMTSENSIWADYCEKCANEYEPAADNEIFMYEECDDGSVRQIKKYEDKLNEHT